MQKNRLLIVTFILGIIVTMGVIIGVVLPKLNFLRHSRTMLNSTTVVRQIQTLSELVTVKYVLEKAIIYEDAKWYGGSRVIIVAHGIVKAGIDLSQLKPGDIKIDEKNKRITFIMPPAVITDAYLDDKQTQILERTTGLLRTFDKNLEQDARKTAMDDIKRAARTNGILKDAEDRARLQFSNLFLQLGFTDVEIRSP